MTDSNFVYLDNAATSWPKPESVVNAIVDYYREIGVAAVRGSSARSMDVDRMVEQCRVLLARLINADSGQIVFCFNGTDGLNTAIGGMIRQSDHVVTTDMEHNSVLRPVTEYASQGKITLDMVNSHEGFVDPNRIASAVKSNTRLVCVSHVSNVTGCEQEIADIVTATRDSNPDAFVLVDAAQSAGHIPVDVQALRCDMLVSSGHKGLLGPLGTGFIFLSPRASEEIRPVRYGGTGSSSESLRQPHPLPFRLESGNPNVGGIAGLLQGVQFVKNCGIERIASKELQLSNNLVDSLRQIEGVSLYCTDNSARSAVVSFNIADQDPQSIAALLDSEFGIHLRAGLHCAPLMHKSLGTDVLGGTLRASPGWFNTEMDIERLVDAIASLASQLV